MHYTCMLGLTSTAMLCTRIYVRHRESCCPLQQLIYILDLEKVDVLLALPIKTCLQVSGRCSSGSHQQGGKDRQLLRLGCCWASNGVPQGCSRHNVLRTCQGQHQCQVRNRFVQPQTAKDCDRLLLLDGKEVARWRLKTQQLQLQS